LRHMKKDKRCGRFTVSVIPQFIIDDVQIKVTSPTVPVAEPARLRLPRREKQNCHKCFWKLNHENFFRPQDVYCEPRTHVGHCLWFTGGNACGADIYGSPSDWQVGHTRYCASCYPLFVQYAKDQDLCVECGGKVFKHFFTASEGDALVHHSRHFCPRLDESIWDVITSFVVVKLSASKYCDWRALERIYNPYAESESYIETVEAELDELSMDWRELEVARTDSMSTTVSLGYMMKLVDRANRRNSSSVYLDESKWYEWIPYEVIEWLCCIHSINVKYRHIFQRTVHKMDIHGRDLPHLDIVNLVEMGVYSGHDRRTISIAIDRLLGRGFYGEESETCTSTAIVATPPVKKGSMWSPASYSGLLKPTSESELMTSSSIRSSIRSVYSSQSHRRFESGRSSLYTFEIFE